MTHVHFPSSPVFHLEIWLVPGTLSPSLTVEVEQETPEGGCNQGGSPVMGLLMGVLRQGTVFPAECERESSSASCV